MTWRLFLLKKLKLTRLSKPAILNEYVQPIALPFSSRYYQDCSTIPWYILTHDNIWITDTPTNYTGCTLKLRAV